MSDDETKALWAKCSNTACGHIWAAAYYPLNMARLSQIIGRHSRCPKCDEPGLLAKQDNGVLKEPQAS